MRPPRWRWDQIHIGLANDIPLISPGNNPLRALTIRKALVVRTGELLTTKKRHAQLDAIGAEYNAYTGKDRTAYYAKVEAHHWETALDVVSDLFLNAKIEQEEITRLGKTIPVFAPGDTVIVNVNVVEGERKRVQAYEGVVIAKRHGGLNETITVRRIFQGVGVERVFLLHSPQVASVKVERRGKVRRAKLFYLRDRVGKATRVKQRFDR